MTSTLQPSSTTSYMTLDIEPIKVTAELLKKISTAELDFDTSNLILRVAQPMSGSSSELLTQLARGAQQAAFANSYSALLIGGSNESTDTGDVAIWLGDGDFGKGKEMNTLKALGMEEWAGQIRPSPSEATEQIELVSQGLRNPYSFAILVDSYIFCFYIGKLVDGWGGLVAAGVWT